MLEKHCKLLTICTALWTVTGSLAVVGTLRDDHRLMFWAVMIALMACVPSGWLVAICAACRAVREERIELEHLVEIAASAAIREVGPHRVH